MASKLLSKFVKSSPSSHGRQRSESSPSGNRSRTASTSAPSNGMVSSSSLSVKDRGRLASSTHTAESSDADSINPHVTIVPPTPLVASNNGLPAEFQPENSSGSHDGLPAAGTEDVSATHRRTISSPAGSAPEPQRPKSTPPVPSLPPQRHPPSQQSPASRPASRPTTPAPSAPSHSEQPPAVPTINSLEASPQPILRRSSSNRSLNSQIPQISTSPPSSVHVRAATTPNLGREPEEAQLVNAGVDTMSPIVESPTSMHPPHLPSPPEIAVPNGLAPRSKDIDTASILSSAPTFMSVGGTPTRDPKKKQSSKPWRRASSKPTGLAGAIAASGMAMANPVAQLSPPVSIASPNPKRQTLPNPPYLNNGRSASSVEVSPRSSKRSKAGSPKRRLSTSVHSDQNSDYPDEVHIPDYYSGLEDDSSDDDDDSSDQDDLLDLDLGDDMPVTGFAVASSRRNADFHELFPNIPEGDYLIEDYGCALQREILIQGRLYISENHICFHANIFGWVTDLSIPIYDIETLEKKMTAFVIPNAIQITTRQNKYSFASFLSRDNTFDVIYNIWRLVRPSDAASITSSPGQEGGRQGTRAVETAGAAGRGQQQKVTQCLCGKEGKHFTETAMSITLPGTPDRIYNLMFASGFIKDFLAVNQKLIDIQISDWAPIDPGSKLLARNMSYIKPLSGSVGPKQTKCELRDENQYCDFEDHVTTVTTTRTPDVPSGSVFSVKTKTCITWASAASTKVLVTTQVEWTGRSFIKGIIERSCIEGQKSYHNDLEKAMREYIQAHMTEFIPEGVDIAALDAPVAEPEANGASKEAISATDDDGKRRERERNQRAWQWAWDTFDGARGVAVSSTKGALELVRDAWDQSSSTTILYFVIVALVISNIWTFLKIGSSVEAGRRLEVRKMEDREKWIQGVVTALWEEMAAGKGGNVTPVPPKSGISPQGEIELVPPEPVDPKAEIASLLASLDAVETKMQSLRGSLKNLQTVSLNALD